MIPNHPVFILVFVCLFVWCLLLLVSPKLYFLEVLSFLVLVYHTLGDTLNTVVTLGGCGRLLAALNITYLDYSLVST